MFEIVFMCHPQAVKRFSYGLFVMNSERKIKKHNNFGTTDGTENRVNMVTYVICTTGNKACGCVWYSWLFDSCCCVLFGLTTYYPAVPKTQQGSPSVKINYYQRAIAVNLTIYFYASIDVSMMLAIFISLPSSFCYKFLILKKKARLFSII